MNAWFWSKRKVITLGGETAIANTRERKGKSSLFFHKKLFKTMEVKSSDKTVGHCAIDGTAGLLNEIIPGLLQRAGNSLKAVTIAPSTKI